MIHLSDIYEDGACGRRRTLTVGKVKLWWPFPICALLHSSAAVVFGCPVYGGKKRRWWIKPVHRVFSGISNAKYWVEYRLHPTQYHWVDTGLHPGYHDPQEVMLYAAMACLERYIDEQEGVTSILAFNADLRDPANHDKNAAGFFNAETGAVECSQADDQEEAVAIWQWWTEERPRDKARRRELSKILYRRKDRVKWVPSPDHPGLTEMVFKEFEGDEIAMNNEMRRLERKIDDDEQAYLHRLVNIRQKLWT